MISNESDKEKATRERQEIQRQLNNPVIGTYPEKVYNPNGGYREVLVQVLRDGRYRIGADVYDSRPNVEQLKQIK